MPCVAPLYSIAGGRRLSRAGLVLRLHALFISHTSPPAYFLPPRYTLCSIVPVAVTTTRSYWPWRDYRTRVSMSRTIASARRHVFSWRAAVDETRVSNAFHILGHARLIGSGGEN